MNRQRLVSALRELLSLTDGELEQIISYASGLDDAEAAQHLGDLLGTSQKSLEFISLFLDARTTLSVRQDVEVGRLSSSLSTDLARNNNDTKVPPRTINDALNGSQSATSNPDSKMIDWKSGSQPPPYAAISGSHTARRINQHASTHQTNTTHHTNDLIEASKIRAQDEV